MHRRGDHKRRLSVPESTQPLIFLLSPKAYTRLQWSLSPEGPALGLSQLRKVRLQSPSAASLNNRLLLVDKSQRKYIFKQFTFDLILVNEMCDVMITIDEMDVNKRGNNHNNKTIPP